MIALFDDAGFVLGSYAITFAIVAALVWRTLRAGRRLGERVPDDDKYWT
ncbi:heme exporter protein CcmD [Ilumatobacter sp.]